ncbi:MAG: 5'-3' exonuclease H3TH domain-containing protein [Kineosporiaceae bacterium]
MARGGPLTGAPGRPVLLAVDGDSLLHRAYHSGGSDRDDEGRGLWALRGLVVSLAAAAARLRPDAVVVGFDSRTGRVRSQWWPDYKAQRPPRHPDLDEQLERAPQLLASGGVPVVSHHGYEADDVLASAALAARAAGWATTLLTSDRDSFALLAEDVSVLRLMDGGVNGARLYTPGELRRRYGVDPGRYRDLAALRGDPSDNLPGVHGVGPKRAALLLGEFGSAHDVLQAAADRPAHVEALVGARVAERLADPEAVTVLERNLRLMAMREDLAVPPVDDLRLPLLRTRLVGALADCGIRLGPCLWALVGESEPSWPSAGVDLRAATDATLGRAALAPAVTVPAPARRSRTRAVEVDEDQLALF